MPPQLTRRVSAIAPKHGNAIRSYRLRQGLTQSALARALGVRVNTVSAWERGRSGPLPWMLMRLARQLDTLAEHLYRDDFWPHDQALASVDLNRP